MSGFEKFFLRMVAMPLRIVWRFGPSVSPLVGRVGDGAVDAQQLADRDELEAALAIAVDDPGNARTVAMLEVCMTTIEPFVPARALARILRAPIPVQSHVSTSHRTIVGSPADVAAASVASSNIPPGGRMTGSGVTPSTSCRSLAPG